MFAVKWEVAVEHPLGGLVVGKNNVVAAQGWEWNERRLEPCQ
jgi:hypothetical protein